MRVLYFDTVRRNDLEESLGIEYVQMDRLLAESDVISLHTPLTEQTRGMVDEDAFSRMKRTAIIVNTARGAVVDEDALVRALASGRIAGACIDAYSVEPLASPHPLHKLGERLPNLIVTPHLGYGPRTGMAMIYHAARQVVDGLAGKVPPNVLNPEVLAHRRH
jgi:glyoxylate reductase